MTKKFSFSVATSAYVKPTHRLCIRLHYFMNGFCILLFILSSSETNGAEFSFVKHLNPVPTEEKPRAYDERNLKKKKIFINRCSCWQNINAPNELYNTSIDKKSHFVTVYATNRNITQQYMCHYRLLKLFQLFLILFDRNFLFFSSIHIESFFCGQSSSIDDSTPQLVLFSIWPDWKCEKRSTVFDWSDQTSPVIQTVQRFSESQNGYRFYTHTHTYTHSYKIRHEYCPRVSMNGKVAKV